jgi:predicted nucleic acid-binding protein
VVSGSPIVVDASAAIALIRREPAGPALADVLHASARDGVRLLAPEAFWLEVVNVLIRRYGISPSVVVQGLLEMDDLGIECVGIDRPLLLVTIDLQARFGLSAYDAAYLALAETEDAQLLTLDRQLYRAAGTRAIGLPGIGEGRLSEEPALYGEPVDWARFGAYLGRLRADARAMATPEP